MYLWVFLVVVLLRPDPASHQMVPDSVCQGEEIIPRSSNIAILHQSEMKMLVEGLFYVGHIFYLCNASNADLFAPIVVCLGYRCHSQ